MEARDLISASAGRTASWALDAFGFLSQSRRYQMNGTQDLGAVQYRALRLMWRRTFSVPVVLSMALNFGNSQARGPERRNVIRVLCVTPMDTLERGVQLTRRMYRCRVWLPLSLCLGGLSFTVSIGIATLSSERVNYGRYFTSLTRCITPSNYLGFLTFILPFHLCRLIASYRC